MKSNQVFLKMHMLGEVHKNQSIRRKHIIAYKLLYFIAKTTLPSTYNQIEAITVEVGFYEPGFYELSLFMNFFSIPSGFLYMLITSVFMNFAFYELFLLVPKPTSTVNALITPIKILA